jgi:excisionase family DNA binding protein
MKPTETSATTETEAPADDGLLSTGTVARMLEISGRTVARWIHAGTFGQVIRTKGGKRPGHFRIRKSAVFRVAREMGMEVTA